MTTLLELYQRGVKRVRGVAFVFDVPGRQVLLQRRLWPPNEAVGNGDCQPSYVLGGIEGEMGFTGMPPYRGIQRIFFNATAVTVPEDAWRMIMVVQQTRVPAQLMQQPEALCVFAAASQYLNVVKNQTSDLIGLYPVDQVARGQDQCFLYEVPEMLMRAFAAVAPS